MDARYLSYEDQTFDGVIDKAMLDSISVKNFIILFSVLKILYKVQKKLYLKLIEF
jgi:hypothetical protein